MSDLRPKGVKVELGGEEHLLLFTLSAIDDIQSRTNLELFDAMEMVVKAAGMNTGKETRDVYVGVVTALLNDEGKAEYTEDEVRHLISLENYRRVALAVMEAFGVSIPEPSEDDDDEEDEAPKETAGG